MSCQGARASEVVFRELGEDEEGIQLSQRAGRDGCPPPCLPGGASEAAPSTFNLGI
jgi:hypothetical protein